MDVDFTYNAEDELTPLDVPAPRGLIAKARVALLDSGYCKSQDDCALRIETFDQPKFGSLELDRDDGSFTYQPSPRARCKTDRFEYTLLLEEVEPLNGVIKIKVPSSVDRQRPKITCLQDIEVMVGEEIPWIIKSSSDNCIVMKTQQKAAGDVEVPQETGPLLVTGIALDGKNRNTCTSRVMVRERCNVYECSKKKPCCDGYFCNDWGESVGLGSTCDFCQRAGRRCKTSGQCCADLLCQESGVDEEGEAIQKCTPKCRPAGKACNSKVKCCEGLDCKRKGKNKKGKFIRKCESTATESCRKSGENCNKTPCCKNLVCVKKRINKKGKAVHQCKGKKCRGADQRCDGSKGIRCCSPLRCKEKLCSMPLWLVD